MYQKEGLKTEYTFSKVVGYIYIVGGFALYPTDWRYNDSDFDFRNPPLPILFIIPVRIDPFFIKEFTHVIFTTA